MLNKPNLFIVGAAKAGTTSLYHYLNAHEEIYMSPVKEPGFFCSDIRWDGFRKEYKKGTQFVAEEYFSQPHKPKRHITFIDKEKDYLRLFENSSYVKYRGEASTAYLYSQHAAAEIFKFNPKAKIIIILREPVERVLSHYFMDVSGGVQKEGNILKALKKDYTSNQKGWGKSNLYIELSLYFEQVKRYIKIFPKEQILFLKFEDLKKDNNMVMQEVFQFLDLTGPKSETAIISRKYNKTRIPRNNVIKGIVNLKKYIPNWIIEFLKPYSSFFLKPKEEISVPEDAIDFISDLVKEDWSKTKEIIELINSKELISGN